ncbi:MAG: FtsX-like permease family protein [Eubacteriales bacterium]|nr:FtsX-like permease family protein [Eubacteriales bacterium]
MVNVKNQNTLRQLTARFLKINRGRNQIAILAIALTSLLFTSLFTGVSSMLLTKRLADMKSYMSYSHAYIRDLTQEEAQQAIETIQSSSSTGEYGEGLFFGLAMNSLLTSQTEVRYGDLGMVKSYNCVPSEGTLPESGNEIALSTVTLDSLGIPRTLGETVTLTILQNDLTGASVTDTFTLCGYWNGDNADNIQLAWISKDYALENAYPATRQEIDDGLYNGTWSCAVWFKNSWNLTAKVAQLNQDLNLPAAEGFQGNPAYLYTDSKEEDGFSYLSLAGIILLIILAGCLIIYNIFSISVKTDIRAYALLKNIGTTGKQLKKIVRMQALFLSAVGIPLGLLLGYLAGLFLAPTLSSSMDGNLNAAPMETLTSANPLLFLASALLSLLTVYLSSMQACRTVARVSPVEALRMTEGGQSRRKTKRNFSVNWLGMALQNLLRNWKKGLVVMLSIAISLVTLNCIIILVQGFNFDEYKSIFLNNDFQLNKITPFYEYSKLNGISKEVQKSLDACPYAENTGLVYYTEERHEMAPQLRQTWERITEKYLDSWGKTWKKIWEEVQTTNKIPVRYYGLDRYAFENLTWLGDACTWEEFSSGDAILVDFPNVRRTSEDDHYYRPGDTLTMQYRNGSEKEYQVLGEVLLPYSLKYPYGDLISISLYVPEDEFIAQTGENAAMNAFLDSIDGQFEKTQQYLEDSVLKDDSSLNLISVLEIRASFQNFIRKYYLIGGCLALVLAFIGIMNFFNTTATSLISRRQELALLETVGMSKKQLQKMLVAEGCIYLIGALLLAVLLTVFCARGLLTRVLGTAFFFEFRLTVLPSLLMLPLLLAVAYLIPRRQFRRMRRESLVERIRQA